LCPFSMGPHAPKRVTSSETAAQEPIKGPGSPLRIAVPAAVISFQCLGERIVSHESALQSSLLPARAASPGFGPGPRIGRFLAAASTQSRPGRTAAWSGRPQEEHRRWPGDLPEVHGAGQAAQAAGETRDRGTGPACAGGWPGRLAGRDGGRVPPGLAMRADDGSFWQFPDPGRRHRWSSNSPVGGPSCRRAAACSRSPAASRGS
jgi:hypothetical protein